MFSKNHIVYLITNIVTGKKYVGVTCNGVNYRFRQHVRHAAQGKVRGALYDAIRKHGAPVFTVKQIDWAETAEAVYELEKKWIAHFATCGPDGYNMTPGGECAFFGPKSDEHKRKISEAHKGKPRPYFGQLNRSRTGIPLGDRHRKNISDSQFIWVSCVKCRTKASTTEFNRKHNTNRHFGRPHGNTGKVVSEATKVKLAQAGKGRVISARQRRLVAQLNSKTWQITLPSGEQIIVRNLSRFCKERGLNYSKMAEVGKGHWRQHRQHQCVLINDVREVASN